MTMTKLRDFERSASQPRHSMPMYIPCVASTATGHGILLKQLPTCFTLAAAFGYAGWLGLGRLGRCGRHGRLGRPRIAAYFMDRKHKGMRSFQDRIGVWKKPPRQGRQVYDSVTEALQAPQSVAWSLRVWRKSGKSWANPWEKHGKKHKNHEKIACLGFWTAGYKSSQIHPA